MLGSSSVGSITLLKWGKHSSPIAVADITLDDSFQDVYAILESSSSIYKEAILGYISDYIATKMLKEISCIICSASLTNTCVVPEFVREAEI